MVRRRTFAEVEESARKQERDDVIDQMCRVLKHHMGQPELADEIYRIMNSGDPLNERPVRTSIIN